MARGTSVTRTLLGSMIVGGAEAVKRLEETSIEKAFDGAILRLPCTALRKPWAFCAVSIRRGSRCGWELRAWRGIWMVDLLLTSLVRRG